MPARYQRAPRLPYGVYKTAQIQKIRQAKRRREADLDQIALDTADNVRIAKQQLQANYEDLMGVPAVAGRGAYSFAKGARGFRRGMAQLGKVAGPQIRGALSSRIASGIRGSGLYSGRGAYTANNLVNGGRPSMEYVSANDETQTLIISHREYLQDIFGASTAGFTCESWNLNPGLTENFPWLSQIAMNYEEYEFIQLVYDFQSTVDPSATNNTSGACGTIIMATNYNAASPKFTNKETMMQYHGANSGRVTEHHCHGVECDPAKNAGAPQKYTRVNPVQSGQDLKSFDLGTFQLAQVNLPSTFFNQQIGELWVTYTVKLTKPRVMAAMAGNVAEYRVTSTPGTETLANPLASPLFMQQSVIPMGFAQYNDGSAAASGLTTGQFKLTFPDFATGLYEIQIFVEGSGLTWTLLNTLFGGQITLWSDMYGWGSTSSDSPSYYISQTGGGSGIFITRVFVQPSVGGTDNTCTVNMVASAGTINQVQVVVRQCNPTLAQSNSINVPLYVNASGTVVAPA